MMGPQAGSSGFLRASVPKNLGLIITVENAHAATARVFCNLYAPVCNDAGGYLSPVFRRLMFMRRPTAGIGLHHHIVRGVGRDVHRSQASVNEFHMQSVIFRRLSAFAPERSP